MILNLVSFGWKMQCEAVLAREICYYMAIQILPSLSVSFTEHIYICTIVSKKWSDTRRYKQIFSPF